MNKAFLLPESKFAMLALTNVRADVPEESVLRDGTYVLDRMPIELEENWRSWLGIEFNHISIANVVLVRAADVGFLPEELSIADSTNMKVAKQLDNLFSMLRLLGSIEYQSAFLVMGYTQNGKAVCQNYSRLRTFGFTRGCLPWMLRLEHLEAACDLSKAKTSFLSQFSDSKRNRLVRGWVALNAALQQYYASDRIHGFVRALEAVIYPEISRTAAQFVHRCSLFAAPNTQKSAARKVLEEAYQMRCDVEHVHDWDRSLGAYDIDDRENVAYWRTRQMETLACATYARIFEEESLRKNFHTDATIAHFWQMPEHEIRASFGRPCDITELNIVSKYDAIGRAQFSEWPEGWLKSLEQQYPRKW